ncbi:MULTISPECIES: hypothetical protein [unclassified Mucilaginibacter]|uniref:hypothetical protein n=1 Tax=unclassified Mucilaginibacter TaxID=2617802 RepID=UPI0031F6A14F
MEHTLTVQEVLEQGRKQLLLPRILLLFGALIFIAPLTLLALIVANYTNGSGQPLLIMAGVILFTFFLFIYLPFRYWSRKMISWNLWAFAHCSDVHQLRKDAKLAGLYLDNDTLIGRMLPITPADRAIWKELNERFAQPVQFVDDPGVPAKTTIGISWRHWLFNFAFQLLGMGLATIVLIYAPKDVSLLARILAGGLLLALAYTMITLIRDMLIKRPELILDDEGIQTVQSGFHSWKDIKNERIVERSLGKGARSDFLCYDHSSGSEDLKLTLYAIGRIELERLLYVYRRRYDSHLTAIDNNTDQMRTAKK